MSYTENVYIKYADSPAIDPFGRLRVSDPITLFDSKLLYDKNPLIWSEVTNGTATSTHSTSTSSVTMAVSANNDYAIRQTFMRFNYQPGKGQMVLMTGVFGTTTSGVTKRIGYFNSSTTAPYTSNLDGLYFEDNGTNLGVVVRNNGTETRVARSSWNLDKMDGTGVSGINLDFTKAQIMVIDFEWLGVGRVRFGFVVGGAIYYCHQILNSNVVSSVYMISPNHSIRYEIRSSGGASNLMQICSSVMSEGGVEPKGRVFSVDLNTNDPLDGNSPGTFYALVAIRLKTTHLTARVDALGYSAISSTGSNYLIRLLLNPTVAGTFTFTDVTNSACQYALGDTGSNPSTNTVTGGTVLDSNYLTATSGGLRAKAENAVHIGAALDGTRDILVVAVSPTTSNEDFYGSLTWREI